MIMSISGPNLVALKGCDGLSYLAVEPEEENFFLNKLRIVADFIFVGYFVR